MYLLILICYDASLKQECVIKTCVDVVVADYAMLSLCTNHLGATAIKYCPRCLVCFQFFSACLHLNLIPVFNEINCFEKNMFEKTKYNSSDPLNILD